MNDRVISTQIKKQLAFAEKDSIQSICQPLTTHLGIKSLVYKSVRHDGSEISITTHPQWVQYYFDNHLYRNSVLEKEPANYVKGELLWSHIPTHSTILQATREKFDIDNGITLIRPFAEGCDFFYLGAQRDNYRASQMLMNNIDLLDKFTHFFKFKAQDIIAKAKAHPLMITNKFKDNLYQVSDIPCYQNQMMRTNFLNELYKEGICFSVNNQNIYLTRREYTIAKELLTAKTMKQTAENLFISPRTVETHLDNIKLKFGIRKKSALLTLLTTLL